MKQFYKSACIFLFCLSGISTAVSQEPSAIAVVPNQPVLGEPFIVHAAEQMDEGVTHVWEVYRDGVSLDPSDYQSRGGWLKFDGATAGEYTIILAINKDGVVEKRLRTLRITTERNASPATLDASPLRGELFATAATQKPQVNAELEKAILERFQKLGFERSLTTYDETAPRLAAALDQIVERYQNDPPENIQVLLDEARSKWNEVARDVDGLVAQAKLEEVLKDIGVELAETYGSRPTVWQLLEGYATFSSALKQSVADREEIRKEAAAYLTSLGFRPGSFTGSTGTRTGSGRRHCLFWRRPR